MNHNERKSFTLPSGWTLAQSWAALRKAWLGFKIALSNGDAALMTHYASFITKVQSEMGIEITDFDPAILDEQAMDEISRSCFYKKQQEARGGLEEKSVDYDSVMENARTFTNTKSLNPAPPRQTVFNKSRDSCWYPPQEKIDDSTDSCWYPPQEKIDDSTDSCWYPPQEKIDDSTDSCWYPPQEKIDDSTDSCWYPPRPGSGNETQSQVGIDFQDDVSTKDNKGRESSKRRSCFYKSNV